MPRPPRLQFENAIYKTPQPNLCRGMQHWLSGYANWHAKRNHRSGRLYQGRYKAFPVEDEGYYWNLSLSHPDSSSDLVKRAKRNAQTCTETRRRMNRVEKRLALNPKSRT